MQEDAVALLVQGVVNVMRHLDMLDAEGAGQNKKSVAEKAVATTILTTFEWLYAKHEGMWYPKVAPGDLVKKAQEIGTVRDLFGDTLEKITSPVNGVILFLTINPSVLENGLLMGIGAKK
jgi:uncharacterized protein